MLRRFPSLPTTEALSGAQSRLKQGYCFLTGKVTGKGLERKGGGEENWIQKCDEACLGWERVSGRLVSKQYLQR